MFRSKQKQHKIIAPNNLNFKPFVAGPANETYWLSNVLDILVKPLTKYVKSCVKDRTDFLNKLPKEIPKDSLLVCFDAENLYTNIPHEFGLDAIKCWLYKYPTEIPTRISQTFILNAFDFILKKKNTFQFNDKYYRQMKGTAMGTKCAPTYAT